MFCAWRSRLGRPESFAAATEAAAWVAIVGAGVVNPAAGWASLCLKLGVPAPKFFAGMGIVLVLSGSVIAGIGQLAAAALSHLRISPRKIQGVQEPHPHIDEFLRFV